MQVIPAVDVFDGKAVRLLEGDYDQVTVYGEDPVARAAAWMDQGAALVHVVDLAGARDGTHDEDLWRALTAAGVAFQVGGGIRDSGTAERAIAAGASRVVMGTAVVWNPELIVGVVETIGAKRLVAALDVRSGRATGAGWRDGGRDLAGVVGDAVAAGVVRALVTGIGRDGKMTGPDLDVIATVRTAAPGMALIGSGGVGTIADLRRLAGSGVEGAIVGRALYEGRFTVGEALEALRN